AGCGPVCRIHARRQSVGQLKYRRGRAVVPGQTEGIHARPLAVLSQEGAVCAGGLADALVRVSDERYPTARPDELLDDGLVYRPDVLGFVDQDMWVAAGEGAKDGRLLGQRAMTPITAEVVRIGADPAEAIDDVGRVGGVEPLCIVVVCVAEEELA